MIGVIDKKIPDRILRQLREYTLAFRTIFRYNSAILLIVSIVAITLIFSGISIPYILGILIYSVTIEIMMYAMTLYIRGGN